MKKILILIIALVITSSLDAQDSIVKKYLYEKGTYKVMADSSYTYMDTIYNRNTKGFEENRIDTTYYDSFKKKLPVYFVTKKLWRKGRFQRKNEVYFEADSLNKATRKFTRIRNKRDYIIVETRIMTIQNIYKLKQKENEKD